MTELSVQGAARAATFADYLALLKPRVMSLVVFTGLVGYVIAPGAGNGVLGFAAILAIAAGAGASGALNMWFDSDIDAVMTRTRARPIPAGKVARDEALMLGVFLSVLAVTTMQLAAGPLAAGLLAFTILFYVVVYTMWLKRLTAQNIVIGGLAGALPPSIAWAAKTGAVALEPLALTAIIFMWTPAHFWSLALIRSDDYRAAHVPMLPVSKGAAATRRGVLFYAVVTAVLALAPLDLGFAGPIYLAAAGLGGIAFVVMAVRVAFSKAGEAAKDAPRAAQMFGFSIFYLFALFTALLAERFLGFAP